MTIADRVEMDTKRDAEGKAAGIYEPVRHLGTGVDEEEALYEAYLLPVAEAEKKLRGTVMGDVVRRAREGISLRRQMEDGGAS